MTQVVVVVVVVAERWRRQSGSAVIGDYTESRDTQQRQSRGRPTARYVVDNRPYLAIIKQQQQQQLPNNYYNDYHNINDSQPSAGSCRQHGHTFTFLLVYETVSREIFGIVGTIMA